MCTLILMRNAFPDHPLVVASNRDEDGARPSAEPTNWSDHPEIYAPRDLVLSGTWIGVNRFGVFAALTNRDDAPQIRGEGSRGRLVSGALATRSARDARLFIEQAFTRSTYNGFHLAVADATDALLLIGNGDELIVRDIPAGCTPLTAYGTTPGHAPRATEIERRARALMMRADASPEGLDSLLNFHADHSPRAAACVHDPNESHKTISSMVVRVDSDWSAFETWHRTGPACSGPLTGHHFTPITR